MKLKIFKKMAAVFYAAIMTTSAFGMSASAKNDIQESSVISDENFSVFMEEFRQVFDDIVNIESNTSNMNKKAAVISYLANINMVLVNQYTNGYTIAHDIYQYFFGVQLSTLRDIINMDANADERIDMLYSKVLEFYNNGNINQTMAENLN